MKILKTPSNHQDIVELLSKLKEETPDYPAELLNARKDSFLKQDVNRKISKEDQNSGCGLQGGVGTHLVNHCVR